MTRVLRNRLLAVVFVAAAIFAGPRLGNGLVWGAALVVAPIIGLALWVTAPFRLARALMGKQQYDAAAAELAAFESSITQAPWKRTLAALAVGLYTSNPVAASRNTLGAVRLEQGKLEDAETHFQAALQLDPGYAVPWGNLAVLAAMRGDATLAEDARRKAATLGFKPKVLSEVIRNKLAAR